MGTNRFQVRLPKQRMPADIHARIEAKARLWDFLNDIKENVTEWPDTEIDLANQLSTSAISILIPHYNGIEIERELRNVYSTLKREVPEGFVGIFTDAYEAHILAKLNKSK